MMKLIFGEDLLPVSYVTEDILYGVNYIPSRLAAASGNLKGLCPIIVVPPKIISFIHSAPKQRHRHRLKLFVPLTHLHRLPETQRHQRSPRQLWNGQGEFFFSMSCFQQNDLSLQAMNRSDDSKFGELLERKVYCRVAEEEG